MEQKPDPAKLTFRRMTFQELKDVIHRQNQEDWYLCENEAEAIYSVDPNGFFASEYEGKLIGTLAIINYGDGLKYGTLYTTMKEFRGMGLGPPLFEYGVKQADFERPDECSLGEAEPHILPIYKKRKWEILSDEHCFEQVAQSYPKIEGIVDLKTIPLDALFEYDKKVFGYSRESYLRLILKPEDHYGVGKIDKEGKMTGFGILKRLKPHLFRLTLWSADDKDTAREILQSAQNCITGTPMCVTMVEINTNCMELMKEDKWEKVYSGYKIFMHQKPKTDWTRAYGFGGDFN